jgi:hypothetical protein
MYRGLLGLPATQNQEASLASVFAPPPIVGNWALLNAGPFGTTCEYGASLSTDVIYFHAFPLTRRITISSLGARVVNASAGGNFALAIYAHGRDTPVGVPLAATGNMSTASTTAVTSSITGGNVTLAPGIYWSAVWQDNATAGFANISHDFPNLVNVMIGNATASTVITDASVSGISLAVIKTFNSSAWPNPQNETIYVNNNLNLNAAIMGRFA